LNRDVQFSGVVEAGRGGGAFVRLPDDVAAALGTRRAVRVQGSVNGVAYRSNVMPLGGGAFALGLHKAVREAAGVVAGDTVTVVLDRDDEPREIVVPPELQGAIDADPDAKSAWERLAPSHRREHANAVADAKRPETANAASRRPCGRSGSEQGGAPGAREDFVILAGLCCTAAP
jgi:antitoxin component of MazEF toxin-antitoxin module